MVAWITRFMKYIATRELYLKVESVEVQSESTVSDMSHYCDVGLECPWIDGDLLGVIISLTVSVKSLPTNGLAGHGHCFSSF